MWLSDVSVKRPVFATVISLLLIIFGLVSLDRLAVREYPDVDRPVVAVTTSYSGASAQVIETKITQIIEDSIAGIEGILKIESDSEDERSQVRIEFDINRDMDAAANDVRDRVARVLGSLPEESDPPEVIKADASAEAIMFLNFSVPSMSMHEVTDYAERNLVDRFSTVPGVARVFIGGGRRYAMRIWVDRQALAARLIKNQRGMATLAIRESVRSFQPESRSVMVEGDAVAVNRPAARVVARGTIHLQRLAMRRLRAHLQASRQNQYDC